MTLVKIALCLLATIAICGCGSSTPDTVKVTGIVTYNGEPVDGATVVFGPATGEGRAATGTTGPDGRFELSTFDEGDGALPGSYVIAISKTEVTGGMTPDQEHEALKAGKKVEGPKTIEHLPVRYKDATKSGLAEEVLAGEKNDFVFELTD